MDTDKRLKVLIIHHDPGASCAYTAIARSAGWEVSTCEDTGDFAGAVRDDDVDVLIFRLLPGKWLRGPPQDSPCRCDSPGDSYQRPSR